MLNRIYLVSRQQVPAWLRVTTFCSGITVGLACCVLILMLGGVSFHDIVNEFVVFIFWDESGFILTLTSFVPLALVGLAAAAAIRLKFWNIGIEGQMWMGAIAATIVSTYDIGPENSRLSIMFVAAVFAGSLWIGIPAALKLRYGVNEIITTLLLSYVAFLLVQNLLFGVWRDPDSGFPASAMYDPGIEQLAKIGWGNLHSGIWIAMAAGIIWWWIMNVSRFGYLMDAVGANPLAAKAAGLPVFATIAGAVFLSGGLAGVAGMVIVAGQEYRLTIHIAEGYTFSAIVIAFIARFNPVGVLIAALAIAGIHTAGETLKVFYQLPNATVVLLEAVILLSLLVAEFFGRYNFGLRKVESRQTTAQ